MSKNSRPLKRVRKKIGDVIEIPTSHGLAYVQYTHDHRDPPVYGSLIRILQGFYEQRPSEQDLEAIVIMPHRFQTFCPVHFGVNTGDWELVGNFPVPEFTENFPVFKNTNSSLKTPAEKMIWWLWDGKKSWKVGELSEEEQMKYPFKGGFNDTGLISVIETGEWAGRKYG